MKQLKRCATAMANIQAPSSAGSPRKSSALAMAGAASVSSGRHSGGGSLSATQATTAAIACGVRLVAFQHLCSNPGCFHDFRDHRARFHIKAAQARTTVFHAQAPGHARQGRLDDVGEPQPPWSAGAGGLLNAV
ncbi:MAG: hypothetical protein R3E50_07110 [Halioglobus sp.]